MAQSGRDRMQGVLHPVESGDAHRGSGLLLRAHQGPPGPRGQSEPRDRSGAWFPRPWAIALHTFAPCPLRWSQQPRTQGVQGVREGGPKPHYPLQGCGREELWSCVSGVQPLPLPAPRASSPADDHSPHVVPRIAPSRTRPWVPATAALAGAPAEQLLCKIGFSFLPVREDGRVGGKKGTFLCPGWEAPCPQSPAAPSPARVLALLLFLPSPPTSPVGCPRGRLGVGGGPCAWTATSPEGQVCARRAPTQRVGSKPGPPRGSRRGGPRSGNGFWAGGIYRLLFTKTRAVKHLTAAN